MNTKQILILIFIASCLMGSSCCKKDEPPPPPNNEPSNEMTAVIDGVPWEACKPSLIGNGTSSNVQAQNFVGNYLDVEGTNTCNNTSNYLFNVYFKLYSINGIGTYQIKGTDGSIGAIGNYSVYPNIFYYTDSIHNGTVTITKFDTSAKLISGTFEFHVYNIDSNKIVTVTNGQFINIYYYEF